MATQIETNMFQSLNDSINRNGNVISGNPELNPDSFLDALESMPVDFEDDDRAKPIHPTVFANSSTIDKLLEIESKKTSKEKVDLQKRKENILDKKYKEHLDDLESRKIID